MPRDFTSSWNYALPLQIALGDECSPDSVNVDRRELSVPLDVEDAVGGKREVPDLREK